MPEPKAKQSRTISYRDAGVDIDAGNALVDAIKPLAKATRRPGADADLGGFGALFDLKRAGFNDPILVAANDGVGTKLKIAIETGRHDTIGIDLVAMCVNDLLAQGAEPLFFLDYFATGKLDVAVARAVVAGIAEGCRQAGCALIGGETAEMPGMYAGKRLRSRRLRRRRRRARRRCCRAATSRGRCADRAAVVGRAFQRLLAGAPPGGRREARLGRAGAVRRRHAALAEALLTPTRIYVKPVLAARARRRGAIKALAHITGGGLVGEPAARAAGRLAAHVDLGTWQAAGRVRLAACEPAASTTRRCCAPSTAASAWSSWSRREARPMR